MKKIKYIFSGVVICSFISVSHFSSYAGESMLKDSDVYNDCIKYEFSDEADELGDGFVPGLIEFNSAKCMKIADCYSKYKKKGFSKEQIMEKAKGCIEQERMKMFEQWEKTKKQSMTYLEASLYTSCVRNNIDLKAELTHKIVQNISRQCDKFAECVDKLYFAPITDTEEKRMIEIEKTNAGEKGYNMNPKYTAKCADFSGLVKW